jgi:hypothetical protein
MSLDRGSKLGPYEILTPLGAGGMVEVCRACDMRLDRTVPIEVCNRRFSECFEREVRVNAVLNHVHNRARYDVGPGYVVRELVEGPVGACRQEGHRSEYGTLAAN